ncbi:hypothetical protein Sjap_001856 [Stephania japonica]|uniref:Uncharacterized protein n=1 Tax=Stephania japonica TaxID=461633 RepID=A0AAP0PVH2_9MAGN
MNLFFWDHVIPLKNVSNVITGGNMVGVVLEELDRLNKLESMSKLSMWGLGHSRPPT